MIYDIQRASVLKRISAYLFDIIILVIAAVGLAFLLSTVLGYDSYSGRLGEIYKTYEDKYGVSFEMTAEEFEALTEDELEKYNEAAKALTQDGEAQYVYSMIVNLTLIILTFGILIAFLIFEFIIPLILKNGQTLGKKIFGIGVMRVDGVKITSPVLFARAVLGKCTVETLLPVYLILLAAGGTMGAVATLAVAAILITQVILLFATKNRSQLHDLISSTVTVDLASQLIFNSPEELIEYKKKIHEEIAEKAEY